MIISKRHGAGLWLLAAGLAWAQDASAPSPTTSPSTPTTTAAEAIADLSLEDLLAAARSAIERAEERGEDVQTTLTEAGRLSAAALIKNPGNIEARYYQARIMIMVNRIYEALPILKEWSATPAGQSDPRVFQLLGDLYRDTYPSLAIPQYETAIRLNDKDVKSYVGMSQAFVKQGRKEDALKAAQKAVSKDVTDNPAVRAQLVQTLLNSGSNSEAESEAVRVVTRARALAQVSRDQAAPLKQLEVQLGVLISIMETRLSATAGVPDDYITLPQLRLDRAATVHELTYFDALGDLNAGIQVLGSAAPVNLYVERARLLIAVHRIDDAVKELQAILAAHPDEPTAKEILNQIERATAPASTTPTP